MIYLPTGGLRRHPCGMRYVDIVDEGQPLDALYYECDRCGARELVIITDLSPDYIRDRNRKESESE